MKIAIIAGYVVLVGVLALCLMGLNNKDQALAEAEHQLQSLQRALADKTKEDALAMQQKCAAQAEKVFRDLGYSPATEKPGMDDVLQSHFNGTLNKCFITIQHTDLSTGRMFDSRIILDAYEQREYGEYTWMSAADPADTRKYWEIPPLACKTMPIGKPEDVCRSEDEYKAFVRTYME